MNDLRHAGTFFLIFALVTVLYGSILAKTGNKDLMPYRAIHSISGPSDVKRVGRIVVVVGLVIAGMALLMIVLAG